MKRTNHFHLSFFHIFGVSIILTGIFLMWCAYNGAGQKKIITPEDNTLSEVDEDIEEMAEFCSSIKSRSDTAMRMSLAIFGGLCIMGGVPAFYVSHADMLFKFPKKKKYVKKQEPEEEEFEEFKFDYDNFDFDQYCFIEKDDAAYDIEPSEFKSDSDVINHIKKHYKKKDDK